MREFNHERVIFYGRNDYAASIFRDRCLAMLTDASDDEISTVNEAIEAHQIKLTVEGIPEIFSDQAIDDLLKCAKVLFSKACRYVVFEMKNKGIDEFYDQTELQYVEGFWQLVEALCAWKHINAADFARLLNSHLECIGMVLQYENPLDWLASEIEQALINNPNYSAEIIIGRLAVESTTRASIYLPRSMENSDIDTIMLKYIDAEIGNPNYLSILCKWPDRKTSRYSPSPEVRVKTRRRYDKSMSDLFQNGAGLKYSTGVTICMSQIACKGVARDGFDLTHSFSGRWLKDYTDFATIMNNLIYVFDFVGASGLMLAPARKHEEHGILATLGMRAMGEYHGFTGFQMRSNLTYLETRAYADFLEANGARLESAIEWVYNHYFADEFGIFGFSLALPSKEASWLDKCKAIGPEIERAVKAYSLYAKYGEIDDDFFPYENVKSFSSPKALEEKKYAIAGPNFERYGGALFSDQCMLSYLHEEGISESSFFEIMKKHFVSRDGYAMRSIYMQILMNLSTTSSYLKTKMMGGCS